MYTRKQQMKKVDELDKKVDAIGSNVMSEVDKYLTENLAQVAHFNHCVLETMREILTEKQQEEFFDVMSEKMDKLAPK